jgi:hypothetical protein
MGICYGEAMLGGRLQSECAWVADDNNGKIPDTVGSEESMDHCR